MSFKIWEGILSNRGWVLISSIDEDKGKNHTRNNQRIIRPWWA